LLKSLKECLNFTLCPDSPLPIMLEMKINFQSSV
jgi:hypothetical protein